MTTTSGIRKTKVVATIGPASDSVDTIVQMILAGMNVARLNFSHGSHDEHARRLGLIREASERLSASVAVMLDTKGAEIRTGSVEDGEIEIETGNAFALWADDRLGTPEGVAISYPELVRLVQPGAAIMIDDGRLELRVMDVHEGAIRCQVVRGGPLSNHKGINVPGAFLPLNAMNEANQQDLLFGVKHDVDYIAASFVRSAADVREIRRFLDAHGATIPVIAKIENASGVKNLDEIVSVSDGTMVARGDLGVEMRPQEVPVLQKKIIRTTVTAGKPVITATQMLDSMERNPRPTRAEASDVANAILDGSSAVMLSGETARGAYPIESVRTMASLALQAEASLDEYGYLQQIEPHPSAVVTEAVSQAAISMARHMNAAAIVTLTESGFTSRAMSKYRPHCPILAVTSSPEVVRKLALNWGVTAVLHDLSESDEEKLDFGLRRSRQLGYVIPGDVVVATAGISRETGSTNMIRVVRVPDDAL